MGIYGTTKELAEKILNLSDRPESTPSAAKAGADSAGLTPGMNPRPASRIEFFSKLQVVPCRVFVLDLGYCGSGRCWAGCCWPLLIFL
jgi:hypothetical protein